MKTKEGPNALKNEAEALNAKPAELTEDELAPVSGGASAPIPIPTRDKKAYDILCPYHDIMDYYECNRPLKGKRCVGCKSLADNGNFPIVVHNFK